MSADGPHAFAGLVELPPEPDRPKVIGAPPAGECVFCKAPATGRLCPKHTCRGGMFVDGQYQWRQRKTCGRPVHRWLAKSEPHEAEDPSGPHDELGDYGARPRQTAKSEWIYAGLCEECGRDEREGRQLLRKLAEQGERPAPASRKGRDDYGGGR